MAPKPGTARNSGRAQRERKVSQRMAVVDEASRQQAAQARLDALENDNDPNADPFGAMGSDDDEFNLEEEEEEDEVGGKKKGKKKGAGLKRKLRGTGADRRGPKTFARLLEEAELERMPPGKPTYLTASAAPSAISAARKFCSVCGNTSGYTCARCGSRYCTRKCFTVHTETRCLKFTV